MHNAARLVWGHADSGPERLALRVGDESWSFDELRRSIAWAMAELEGRGIGRGDRVLVVVPTSAEFVIAYHAILALGATAVTVNTLCAEPELAYFIEDAEGLSRIHSSEPT